MFRQIGRRTVGGGPKATGADELTFCGNLGSGIVFLISRVRLREPNESFYTSSGHRLRDSHVGRAWHWVDLLVRGRARTRISAVSAASPPGPPRLLVLACAATKRPDPGRIPALARYDGPLWRTLRATDPGGRMARVAVLSARYGFRDAATPIADYDARLTPELAARMIAGGVTTRWPRPPAPRPDTFGMPSGAEIAGLTRDSDEPVEDVALGGGRLYLDVMRALVAGFVGVGCVRPEARITVVNGAIGLSCRRVRRPTGACDRVLLGNRTVPVFSATDGNFGCGNFAAAPPLPIPKGGGFATIWQDGRIAWQRREENIPARFLQGELGL